VLKAVDEADGKRTFTGIASTISTDRMDDIVVPGGAKFKLPLPLLWQHNSREPIGWVTAARVSATGIEVDCEVHNEKEPGKLKDRLDEAWQSLKAKLVRGLSIGFNAIEYNRIEGSYGLKYIEWEWLELSPVTIAANQDASILAIKSADAALLAAIGREPHEVSRGDDLPGASGASKPFSLKPPRSQKGIAMKTITEQIAALVAARAEKAARMQSIMEVSVTEGRSSDANEAKEFDDLQAEVAKADEDLARLRVLEKLNVQRAAPAVDDEGRPAPQGSSVELRGGVLAIKSNLPKGIAFARYAMALAGAKGSVMEAEKYVEGMVARKQWHDTPAVLNVLKAASAAGTTTDSTFASSLVYAQDLASEFIEMLRPITILGKFGTTQRFGNQSVAIPRMRQVPFNIRMASQTGGGTYGWVGEGAPKPVGELTITELTMKWAKAAGIIVLTKELARFSNPSAEAIVRDDMLRGMAAFSDLQFISPQVAAVADVSPASVTNLVTDVPATGTDADALRTDLNTLFGKFWTANLSLTSGVFIMSNRLATAISLMRNALGQKEYPDMTPLGGMLEGFPVIASEAVPDDSSGGMIALLNADDIFFADDGPVTIDASQDATIEMSTTPADPTVAATVLVSLWQRNMVALRAERFMNWKKRRSAAVQYISSAAYH
jgi:HK97 family phage major capsid protein/HK97 family phage prohead protease